MSAQKLGTEIRQEQIARAALSLVASRGMGALNVANVAHEVGLVPSAIYRHFKSKNVILDAVVGLTERKLLGNVTAVCAEAPEALERLRLLLARHLAFFVENQALPRLVFIEVLYSGHPQRKARVNLMVEEYLSEVARIIRQGQRQGTVRSDLRPKVAAVMFLGLVQGPGILWHLSSGKFNVKNQVAQSWNIFSEAIRKI